MTERKKPRHPNGEAKPMDEFEAHDRARARMRVIENRRPNRRPRSRRF